MKKTILKKVERAMVIIIICISAFSQRVVAQCEQSEVSFVGKEPTIDLTKFLKTPEEVAKQSQDFIQFIKTGGALEPVDISSEVVVMSAMVDLYKKAAASAPPNSITGLRIIFGMSKNKMVYYYQPVYLVRGTGKSFYTVKDVNSALYYQNTGSEKFDTANLAVVKRDSVFYLKSIMIDQFRKGKFERFVHEEYSWRGDTRSLIFTFQELFLIYHQAYPPQTQKDHYCKTIAIHNGSANYRRRLLNKWRVKHTLYVNVPGMNSAKALVAVAANNDAANLGHLCPPSCKELNFE